MIPLIRTTLNKGHLCIKEPFLMHLPIQCYCILRTTSLYVPMCPSLYVQVQLYSSPVRVERGSAIFHVVRAKIERSLPLGHSGENARILRKASHIDFVSEFHQLLGNSVTCSIARMRIMPRCTCVLRPFIEVTLRSIGCSLSPRVGGGACRCPVAVQAHTYSLAYWLFHAISFERKDFSKIHESKTEKSLYLCCTYLRLSVEPSYAFASVVTDRQTDTQTDRQTGICPPKPSLAHACR